MDDEKLILLVQAYKELYDKRNNYYKFPERKRNIWQNIGKELNASGEICMRRRTVLRDRYARELRKEVAPSGSEAQFYKQWHLLEAMVFLKPHIIARPSITMHFTRLAVRYCTRMAIKSRMYSAEAAPTLTAAADKLIPPVPEGVAKPPNPKLDNIVNSIAGLNLLEVSELSALLKKKLNLPETAFVPQMAAAGPGRSAAADDDEEAAPKKVQTSFKVKLMKFDEKQKVALIKEVKNLLEGMNLVQAKKFVESAPTLVKEDIPKDEADKLKEALEKAGAIIEIE